MNVVVANLSSFQTEYVDMGMRDSFVVGFFIVGIALIAFAAYHLLKVPEAMLPHLD
ncbi:MAG: hypothetical protein HY078_02120 [Elusimicrobia bacterium]|nr:hypothetical protein [Elusimicrobiota bacterium]